MQRAAAEVGHDDFGEATFLEGLERLTDALGGEAALTEIGLAVAEGQILAMLRTRLMVQDWQRRHPDLAGERIERPIFIVGLSRSGTTALSHLLAADPGNRSLLNWEANGPVPPPTAATRLSDPRALAARDAGPSLVERLNPSFAAIHRDPWDMPVECIVLLSQHFLSLGLSVQYAVPTYTRWVVDADHASAYRWHELMLRTLQSGGVRGRWQLKSPQHAVALDALVAQYPDARFVVTHREPAECIASAASLVRSLSSTFCRPQSPSAIGELWAEILSLMAERTMAARARLGDHRFVDIAYRDIRHDPLGTVHRLYAALGDDVSPEADQAMRDHAAVAVPDRRGRHDYSLADFGLDRGAIEERLAPYRDRYAEFL